MVPYSASHYFAAGENKAMALLSPVRSKLTKISDNISDNVHLSGVRFICSPYLGLILPLNRSKRMTRLRPQINLMP